ncbi:MAG TPA: ribosome silencing factor [Clostridiaceae bacterium]|nr:ribosome silencing factor [Clostridiaceae bacterium]
MDSKSKLEKILEFLNAKKAKEVKVIDLKDMSILTDYFVICGGTSTTHIKALADGLDEMLSQEGIKYLHMEGYNSARWILMDYSDVIVHIFHEQEREFYSLERLWSAGIVSDTTENLGKSNI